MLSSLLQIRHFLWLKSASESTTFSSQITDPPEQVRMRAEELVMTLRRRLRNCEPYYTMKLMLVGKGGQGKTTLVHRLREDFSFKEDDLTQGKNWTIKFCAIRITLISTCESLACYNLSNILSQSC